MKKLLLLIFIHCSMLALAQSVEKASIIHELEKINDTPSMLSFSNSLPINNQGGHLQGIQFLSHGTSDYYVVSGSSDTYSYYSIIKKGEKSQIISMNKILDKPFKHAGGFQIHGDLMAIGVEDNEAKKNSKVFIFRLDNPEKPSREPLAIIERIGTYKRATAGCVGITVVNGKVLVVVGDWDAENLDFYLIDEEKLNAEGATLEFEYSIKAKNMDRTNWVNPRWESYQNINFVQDASGGLFLAGMAGNEQEENVLDLFEVKSNDLSSFQLQKVWSKSYPKSMKTKFRWGAGIDASGGHIRIISCGEHIENNSEIGIYK